MSLLQLLLVSATAAFILPVLITNANVISDDCLKCLCVGATQCNATAKCHEPFPGGRYCGPYHISWPFYADATGREIQDESDQNLRDFETCVVELKCATEVVRAYMNKYSRDCDGDGQVNCQDYMRIHKLGWDECSNHLTRDRFHQFFEPCVEQGNVR